MFQVREEEPKPAVQTMAPALTGSSVMALKYKDGVLLATDTLVSYGHGARQSSRERILKINDHCLVAAAGDHADLQYIGSVLQQQHLSDELCNDGFEKSAEEIHSWLARVMYTRRNKMNPLWSNLVVIGTNCKDGAANFLGACDMWGTAIKEDVWSNALGSYFGIPHLRNAPPPETMSLEDAKTLLLKCFKITAGVDCCSSEEIQLAYVDKDGVHIENPIRVQPRF